MNYVPNQNGKVRKKRLAVSNTDGVKTILSFYVISKSLFLFFKFLKYLPTFLCHFATHNIEYYKWLCRLRRHIQVGRLPVQGTWLGLVT